MEDNRYLQPHLSAYIRGHMLRNGKAGSFQMLTEKELSSLTDEDMETLLRLGAENELRLYHFKIKDDLPRVQAVLGFLHGIQPENLLDVGSGRGVFLFPFMRDFPFTPVTSVDILPHRVETLNDMMLGGMTNLTALNENICTWDAPDGSFDVVTMLEVLEHIPDAEKAVRNAVRLAKRFVVVSAPSKPDNNPEHIHLFTKDMLTEMFTAADCTKLKFSGVNGHMIMFAKKREQQYEHGLFHYQISPDTASGGVTAAAR